MTLPSSMLENLIFSTGLAVVMFFLGIRIFLLMKDYSKPVYLTYGATNLGLGLSILMAGNVAKLQDNYPKLLDLMEDEAFFAITCVKVGFLLYYLYSRRLISKELVRGICKRYHPAMTLMFLYSRHRSAWWSNLPGPMLVQPSLFLALSAVTIFRIMNGIFSKRTSADDTKKGQ